VENKANYALIGLFVLATFLAVIGFVIWLSGAQLNKQFDVYEVGVGEVITLGYDRDDPNLVLAEIQITERTPIDVNATAQLTPLGLTGMNFIEITPGLDPEAPLLVDMPGRGMKRIVGQESSVDELLTGGGDVVVAAQTALARTNQLLSPENLQTFGQILDNVEAITASVDVSDLDVNKLNDMMDSIGAAADAIAYRALAAQLRALMNWSWMRGMRLTASQTLA